MPTVVPRYEPSRKIPETGTIYYRIYMGHNKRMEFSSHIQVTPAMWKQLNQTKQAVVSQEAQQIKAKMTADLQLLNTIIQEGNYKTMGDIIQLFKQRQS